MSDSYHDARCTAIYDVFEGSERDDLEAYAAMVAEFGAGSVLDVGRGTNQGRGRPGQLGQRNLPGRELVVVARSV